MHHLEPPHIINSQSLPHIFTHLTEVFSLEQIMLHANEQTKSGPKEIERKRTFCVSWDRSRRRLSSTLHDATSAVTNAMPSTWYFVSLLLIMCLAVSLLVSTSNVKDAQSASKVSRKSAFDNPASSVSPKIGIARVILNPREVTCDMQNNIQRRSLKVNLAILTGRIEVTNCKGRCGGALLRKLMFTGVRRWCWWKKWRTWNIELLNLGQLWTLMTFHTPPVGMGRHELIHVSRRKRISRTVHAKLWHAAVAKLHQAHD